MYRIAKPAQASRTRRASPPRFHHCLSCFCSLIIEPKRVPGLNLMDTRRPASNPEVRPSHTAAKPLYDEGKVLAKSIFLEILAAIDVRRAMFSKIRRQGR